MLSMSLVPPLAGLGGGSDCGVGLSSACAAGREQAFRVQCQLRWAVVVDGCVFVCATAAGARCVVTVVGLPWGPHPFGPPVPAAGVA